MEPYRRCFNGVRGYGGERVMASFPQYGKSTFAANGYRTTTNKWDQARQGALKNRGTTIQGSTTLRFDVSEWVTKFDPTRVRGAMNKYAEDMSRQIVTWMKSNAPWEDRTYNARSMLHANIKHVGPNRTNVQLTHGVFYGKYLEVGTRRMAARPILAPALRHFQPIVVAMMPKLVRAQFQ